MRVLICHERFIGRFGADRVLLILARRFRELGAHVTLMGARFDDALVAPAADACIVTPLDVRAPELEARTRGWLADTWARSIAAGQEPDLVIVGGWPFFTAIPLFRALSRRVLFIDCGVVPEEGYASSHRALLRHLVDVRTKFLPYCTHIAANSRFTMRSQSLPQAGRGVRCAAVLNGIDHLADVQGEAELPADVQELMRDGRRLILLLGRFEPVGYKNSAAAFAVLELLRTVEPGATLLVLEPPERVRAPSSLTDHVRGIGYPDDAGLLALMRHVELGLSVSAWEGFNLPLAEMFWLGKPALAFDVAAHPEVVFDRWYLAAGVEEMSAKAAWVLQGASVVPPIDGPALTRYQQRFTWDHFVEEIVDLVELDPRLLPAAPTPAATARA
jgi:glycosyltransferase involved in cell wall biosynthesis